MCFAVSNVRSIESAASDCLILRPMMFLYPRCRTARACGDVDNSSSSSVNRCRRLWAGSWTPAGRRERDPTGLVYDRRMAELPARYRLDWLAAIAKGLSDFDARRRLVELVVLYANRESWYTDEDGDLVLRPRRDDAGVAKDAPRV